MTPPPPTPRTLLFVSHYTGLGGGESVQLNLMAALAERGYRLHLLTPRPDKFDAAARAIGVQTHTIPFRGVSTWFIPAITTRWPIVSPFAALIAQIAPDVIHSDYHALPYCVGAARATDTPVLWNAMGGWFAIKRWQRDFFRRQVTQNIAITESVRHDLLGDPPFMPPERMPVLIPGVDPNRFAPGVISGNAVRAKIGIDAATPLVSLIGRFQQVKGQDVFLAMARLIADQHPAVRFALSGDNVFGVAADERFKRHIIATVENDPVLKARVTFLGFWPDAREVMAASDVIVCPSRFESLGMAVIEAMAMGCAVVSTRVGGPAETIIDGETGYLVAPGDASAFAARTLDLLHNSAKRSAIGKAARQHVESHLTIDRYTDQIDQLIGTLIKR